MAGSEEREQPRMDDTIPVQEQADEDRHDEDQLKPPQKFSAEEEASLLAESHERKTEANQLFSQSQYEAAISKYEEATSICPHYLDYELAVVKSNIAACHLKLEQWKEASKAASDSIEGLKRIQKAEEEDGASKAKEVSGDGKTGDKKNDDGDDEGDVEEEVVSSGAKQSAPAPQEEGTEEQEAKRKRSEDILRIRAKALMRRARARSELGGWSNLSGAEEDYKQLDTMENLSQADRKIVRTQLRLLPPRTKAAQEQEMSEMWGKLKDLGNGLLKPFGLSTDNFNMVKDEKTGGYSMNFGQGQ